VDNYQKLLIISAQTFLKAIGYITMEEVVMEMEVVIVMMVMMVVEVEV